MIDTHSHLYDEAFDQDRDTVIKSCQDLNVTKIISPAVDKESYEKMNSLADRYNGYIFPTMGLHPTSVGCTWKEDLAYTKQLLFDNPTRYVAIGEIGLDLYWSEEFFIEQCEVLRQQTMWSLDLHKPLILHVRKAYEEIFQMLEPFGGKLRGVFHSFEGEEKHIERINRCGDFYIGVGGVATYKKRVSRLLASKVPLSRIVLETDSPYLTPSPLQGNRNSTENLPVIVKKLSEIYSVSQEEVIRQTTENAERLFFE